MYVIGLDIGTTCTKALLADDKGNVLGVGSSGYPLISNGCEIKHIVMMGGASKSPILCQMIASITHMPILRLNQADICATGAAMIAACGLGIYKD